MIKNIAKKAMIYMLFTLVVAITIGLFFTWGNIKETITHLESYTILSSLLIILGKLLGSLSPTVNITTRTIAAPSLGKDVEKIHEKGWEELLTGWGTLLLGILSAYALSHILTVILKQII